MVQQTMLENGYIENYASVHVEELMTKVFKSNHDSKVGRRFWIMIRHLLTVLPQSDHSWASNSIRVGVFKTGDIRGFPLFKITDHLESFTHLRKISIDENSYKKYEGDGDFYCSSMMISLHNHQKMDFKRLDLESCDIKYWNFTNTDKDLQAAMEWVSSVVIRIKRDSVLFEKYANGHSTFPSAFKNDNDFESIAFLDQGGNIERIESSKVSLKKPENQILYGAAGTGKTYALQQLQQNYTETLANQDHETFLAEKLRDRSWAEVIALVFLDEGRSLKVPEIIEHPYFLAKFKQLGRTANISQAAWGTLQRHTPKDSQTVKYSVDRRSDLALFDKDAASLWHLIEADNEDYLTDLRQLLTVIQAGAQQGDTISRYSFVTFHQSYGYEDFIEGLRPVLSDDERLADSPSDGQVRYEIKQGAFVELCLRAQQDPTHQYAMFIDEINRGNVSKIFGELISLIELDKRVGCSNALSITLPYSKQLFSVPANVSIYGTMNSADRSLTPLDTALRRRFEFVEFLPDPELLAKRELDGQTYTAEVEGINLAGLLDMLNERIEILLGRDYVLGHAYFWSVKSLADLKKIMRNKIIPQLQEHCFEDWDKVRLILADNQKQDPARQFIQLKTADQSKLQRLFGDVTVPVVPSYQVNPWLMLDGLDQDVFVQPETYWAMY